MTDQEKIEYLESGLNIIADMTEAILQLAVETLADNPGAKLKNGAEETIQLAIDTLDDLTEGSMIFDIQEDD